MSCHKASDPESLSELTELAFLNGTLLPAAPKTSTEGTIPPVCGPLPFHAKHGSKDGSTQTEGSFESSQCDEPEPHLESNSGAANSLGKCLWLA